MAPLRLQSLLNACLTEQRAQLREGKKGLGEEAEWNQLWIWSYHGHLASQEAYRRRSCPT